MKLILQLVPFLALALRVRAHGVLTEISGTNGVTGQGFGVIASTPRDGSTRNPFEVHNFLSEPCRTLITNVCKLCVYSKTRVLFVTTRSARETRASAEEPLRVATTTLQLSSMVQIHLIRF